MKSKVIHHGSRHRPSRGRRKYREQRASADEALTLLQGIDQDLEWDDWHYLDSDDGTNFYDEHSFGLHCDGIADLIGGLLTGDELQRLVDPTLWQHLESLLLKRECVREEVAEEWEPMPSDQLIEALLARCQQLRTAKLWNDLITVPDEDLKILRSFWRASDARLTAATAPQGYCLPYQLGIISLLEPFWLRPAASWQRPDGDDGAQFASLLEHLFVRYPVPRFLLDGVDWLVDRNTWKWMLWIVLFGSGASMVRAGRRIGWWVNTSFIEQLMRAPRHLDATSACIWAEVRRQGGSTALAKALNDNHSFRIDPTEVDLPEAPRAEPLRRLTERRPWQFYNNERERTLFRQFWQATIEWMIRHENQLPEERLGGILAWANHEFTEQQRVACTNLATGQPQIIAHAFSWKGRAPTATLRAANEYQERLRRKQGPNRRWNARGWDWQELAGNDVTWSMRELTCSDELFEEGEAMHHCVAAYDWHCVAGDSAIFSLCANGVRVLTIEVDPKTYQIRQAYGGCNRRATSAEMEMVNRWRAEALKMPLGMSAT